MLDRDGEFDAAQGSGYGDAKTQADRKERIKSALDDPDGVTPAEVAATAGVTEQIARDEIETMQTNGSVVMPEQGVYRLV